MTDSEDKFDVEKKRNLFINFRAWPEGPFELHPFGNASKPIMISLFTYEDIKDHITESQYEFVVASVGGSRRENGTGLYDKGVFDTYCALRREGLVDFICIDSSSPLLHLYPSKDILDISSLRIELYGDPFRCTHAANLIKLSPCDWLGKSHFFVLLGLSGSGKNTLIAYVSSYVKDIKTAMKVTTRESRQNDDDTLVVSEETFRKMQRSDEMEFCYTAFDNRYGYLAESLDQSLESGSDLFFETTQLSVARQIKERYPDHARIICLEASDDVVMDRIVRRYSNMPNLTNPSFFDYMAVQNKRLRLLEQRVKYYDEMRESADFVLPNCPLIERQQVMRDYILSQRFPGVLFRSRLQDAKLG